MPTLLTTLRAKLLFGYGLVLLLLVGDCSLAYYNALSNEQAAQRVAHSESALRVANEARQTVDDVEQRYLQYLATGSPDVLAAYEADWRRFPSQIDVLLDLSIDDPEQLRLWRAIRSDLEQIRRDVLDPGIAVRGRLFSGAARQSDVDRLSAATVEQDPFAGIRAEFAIGVEYERQEMLQHTLAVDDANETLKNVLLWGTAIAVMVTIVVAWVLASNIARAVERLAGSAQAIAAGKLHQRVNLHRDDEIGHAAAAFDLMAAALERDVAALEHSEARYRELVSRAGDLVYQADAEGRFTWVNPVATSILGYDQDALVGRHYTELIHPEDRDSIRRAYGLQFARKTPNKYTEFRAIKHDGSAVWLGQNVQLVTSPDGDFTFQAIARDITDRKRAENALNSLQHQTETILNSTAEGIYGVTTDGRCSIVNPTTARLTGYEIDELRGSRIHDLVHHTRADGTPYRLADCPAIQAMRTGEPCDVRNEVFWRKDGTSFPVEYSVVPIREGGAITGAVFSFRDITERRAIERLKDEFISVVSHELRTPLTSIRGSLGLLSAGLLGPISDRATRMVEVAVSNTDRLIRLINDILDIERIESGRVTMDKHWTDARDLVLRSIESIRAVADAARVEVEADVEPILLRADPDRVQQTLTNLIGNSIKFSPAGSTIAVRGRRAADHVLLSVEDQGRGIPADKLERIFGRFEQVDASDAREKGGSGLGLAIARSIVEQHGGRIWAESTPGQGSTFYFTIPLSSTALGGAERSSDGTTPTILICDDDPDIVEVVGEMLARNGFRPIGAFSGEEALHKAAQEQPSAILLDLAMPGMTGWETLLLLKEDAETRDIPVVILSGLERAPNEPAGGHEEWITKPVSADSLRTMLDRVLARRAGPARILVVEDDVDLAGVLSETFRHYGIETHHATTGEEAITISQTVNPDLLLLDLALPSGSGFDVVDWFRQHDRLRRVAVVAYTARDLNLDERRNLELGPTEFLTKGRMTPDEVRRRVLTLLERVVPAA
ncbi:MAG TPA: PAS domain S-box protein [Chloroflexota bacterium]